MKRLLPSLTALALAVAATIAVPSTSRALLQGDELACAGGSAQSGVDYAAQIGPEIADVCIENDRGWCDLDEAGIDDLHDEFVADITNKCSAVPNSFEGFCGGDPIGETAECIADAYDAATRMVADSSVGGGSPEPEVQIINVPVVIHCSGAGQPCFGPGVTGCCRGLVCRVRSVLVGDEFIFTPTCVPGTGGGGYSSPAAAFIDTSRSLLH